MGCVLIYLVRQKVGEILLFLGKSFRFLEGRRWITVTRFHGDCPHENGDTSSSGVTERGIPVRTRHTVSSEFSRKPPKDNSPLAFLF